MIQHARTARFHILKAARSLSREWKTQILPARFYYAGASVTVLGIACTLLGITYRGLHSGVLILGATMLASGIVLEGYWLAEKVLTTRIGKVVGILLGTMIAAWAMAISSVIVNDATGFPPDAFPHTVAFLAPLTAGYLLIFSAIAAFIALPLFVLLTWVASMWPHRQSGREMERASLHALARLAAAIILCVLILGGWNKYHPSYEQSLRSFAGWFVYSFEMYKNDPCVQDENERVRRSGDQILVGRQEDGARSFRVERCVIQNQQLDPG